MSCVTDELASRFEEEALPYLDALYPAAIRLTSDRTDAEDLVQETFLRAFSGLHLYTRVTNVRAWLYRILYNTFVDSIRRRRREPAMAAAKPFDDEAECPAALASPSAESEALARMPDAHVKRALQQLPVQFRITIYLADVEGFGYEEIAAITEVPVGTVRSRLHRGRHVLRHLLLGYVRDRLPVTTAA